MNLSAIYTTATKFVSKNLPKILGVAAIGFGVAAIATTPAATKKVDKHLTEFENRVDPETGEKQEVGTKEFVCTIAADIAIPAALTLAAVGCGAGCIISYDSKVKRLTGTVGALTAEVAGIRAAVDKKYGEGAADKLNPHEHVETKVTTDKKGNVTGVKVDESDDIQQTLDSHHGFWVCDTKYDIYGNVTATKEIMQGLNNKLTQKIQAIADTSPNTVMTEWDILKHFGIKKGAVTKQYKAVAKTVGIKAKDWPAGGVSFTPMATTNTDDDGGFIYTLRGTFPRFTDVME